MKLKNSLLILIFLTACARTSSSDDEEPALHTLSPTKQKQKIGWLEKKLEIALREKKKAEIEVERLSSEIHKVQLIFIRKQLDETEKQIAELQKYPHLLKIEIGNLFIQEREALHQIIKDGPSPCAFEAQVELDRILRTITELSEKREEKPLFDAAVF